MSKHNNNNNNNNNNNSLKHDVYCKLPYTNKINHNKKWTQYTTFKRDLFQIFTVNFHYTNKIDNNNKTTEPLVSSLSEVPDIDKVPWGRKEGSTFRRDQEVLYHSVWAGRPTARRGTGRGEQ